LLTGIAMPLAAGNPNYVALLLAAAVFVLSAWAEWIHARRSAALGRLAFGPAGEPRRWTKAAPLLRVVAGSLLAWGLVILALAPSEALDTTGADSDESAPEDLQRVILLLDVSPSMAIVDAGENRNLERRQRVLQVIEGIFPRISVARTRFTIIAFFTSARPVVVDAYDTAVITNVLDNLPLVWAFEPGKTNVIEGLQATADMARDWAPKSTTVILCTDGDTVDFSQIPRMPRSVSQVQIFAVGDPVVGTFIDGHDSRQQAGVLRRLAAELRGSYYDVNTRHVPSSALAELAMNPPQPAKLGFTWKDLALGAIAIGATIFAFLPLLLEYCGCAWNAERELPVSRSFARETAA
jgi:Ca-activated chloride channel family protein